MLSSLDLLHLAEAAAAAAAQYLRGVERPRDPGEWSRKGARDFVTDHDAAERGGKNDGSAPSPGPLR